MEDVGANNKPQLETTKSPSPLASNLVNIKQRQKKKSSSSGQWIDAALSKAMVAIEEGNMSLRGVACHFNILQTSLLNYLHGKTIQRKRGTKEVLTIDKDKKVVQWLEHMQEIGHSVKITQLKVKVANFVQTRATPFSHGIPDNSWWKWFKVRHSTFSIRIA